jgi:HK97 family phage major capsid protein
MRQMATVISTNSQSVGVPTFDFDGDALWTAENAQIAEEDVLNAFGKQNFTPHKLARILRMPMELTEDAAINVESLMTDHFARRFGEIEENAFINGDGVEKPLGLLEAGLPTTNATAPTFEADDLFNIIYNIRAVYRANGAWMMHREAIRRIRTFVDGNGQYLWQPALTAGQPATLLGFPLTESEFFPDNVDAGSAGDPLLIFGDFSFYWIVDRIDMSIQRLVERYAEFDQIGFKMRLRVDGAPTMSDPFQVLVRV